MTIGGTPFEQSVAKTSNSNGSLPNGERRIAGRSSKRSKSRSSSRGPSNVSTRLDNSELFQSFKVYDQHDNTDQLQKQLAMEIAEEEEEKEVESLLDQTKYSLPTFNWNVNAGEWKKVDKGEEADDDKDSKTTESVVKDIVDLAPLKPHNQIVPNRPPPMYGPQPAYPYSPPYRPNLPYSTYPVYTPVPQPLPHVQGAPYWFPENAPRMDYYPRMQQAPVPYNSFNDSSVKIVVPPEVPRARDPFANKFYLDSLARILGKVDLNSVSVDISRFIDNRPYPMYPLRSCSENCILHLKMAVNSLCSARHYLSLLNLDKLGDACQCLKGSSTKNIYEELPPEINSGLDQIENRIVELHSFVDKVTQIKQLIDNLIADHGSTEAVLAKPIAEISPSLSGDTLINLDEDDDEDEKENKVSDELPARPKLNMNRFLHGRRGSLPAYLTKTEALEFTRSCPTPSPMAIQDREVPERLPISAFCQLTKETSEQNKQIVVGKDVAHAEAGHSDCHTFDHGRSSNNFSQDKTMTAHENSDKLVVDRPSDFPRGLSNEAFVRLARLGLNFASNVEGMLGEANMVNHQSKQPLATRARSTLTPLVEAATDNNLLQGRLILSLCFVFNLFYSFAQVPKIVISHGFFVIPCSAKRFWMCKLSKEPRIFFKTVCPIMVLVLLSIRHSSTLH